MTPVKDSPEVIVFMTLFQKLRGWIDDNPNGLEQLAAEDAGLEELCMKLAIAKDSLAYEEKRQRDAFVTPVDPKFIKAWRDYEERYESPIVRIVFSELGEDSSPTKENQSAARLIWQQADDEASHRALAIEATIWYANERADVDTRQDVELFPYGLANGIEDATFAWTRLSKETGFDLRGILRRRELTPITNIPRHVAKHYGAGDDLSLLRHLGQAQDAFVFGVPYAAIALMRSIAELTLKTHYHASGTDLADLINNCQGLPQAASKPALHRLRKLANKILHFNRDEVRLPADSADFERQLLSLLLVLRELIEGAPVPQLQ